MISPDGSEEYSTSSIPDSPLQAGEQSRPGQRGEAVFAPFARIEERKRRMCSTRRR
jgi:hypothetical protein